MGVIVGTVFFFAFSLCWIFFFMLFFYHMLLLFWFFVFCSMMERAIKRSHLMARIFFFGVVVVAGFTGKIIIALSFSENALFRCRRWA